jgi:hypothetical protein
MAPSLVSVPSVRRRNLLLAVFAALAVTLGGYMILHASSGRGATQKHHHRTATSALAACGSRKTHARRTCAGLPTASRRPAARHAPSIMKLYALGLQPVLDRSRALFDQASRAAASSPNLDALSQVCSQYSPLVQVAADQVEGVPHPYQWYTSVGYFHHGMMGVYHRFQGALNLCATAASNGDSSGSATAISDLATEASHLRGLDDAVHRASAG